VAAAADTFDLMTDQEVAGAERRRLREADAGMPWRPWGPYVSARQWGTVREDDSPDGAAWFAVTRPEDIAAAGLWGSSVQVPGTVEEPP
jgi:hypothetical protein